MLNTLVKWLTKFKLLGRRISKASTLTVDELRKEYSPVRILRYSEARSFLYGVVDNVDGVLAGIYGSLVVHIDNAEDVLIESDGELDEDALIDPSISGAIRKEAKEEGINLEHLWPQSMLKKNGARRAVADMHHMAPAGVKINSLRGNLAFAEVDGHPFAESDQSAVRGFEPQDVSKGNVARALFYIALVEEIEIQTFFSF